MGITAHFSRVRTLNLNGIMQTIKQNTALSNHKTREDIDLERRVIGYLFNRQHQALRSVNVDVEGGVVKMSGKLKSFYEKQLCLHCCQRVAGVMRLVDDIQVM
jgi:osmotically-inducible protein OsmY